MNGAGTSGDPFQIETWEDLHNVRNNGTAYYILMNDLGPNDTGYATYAGPTANSNAGWLPLFPGTGESAFDGDFDGNGHVIDGVNIDTTIMFAGFFGLKSYNTSGKNIRNLGITNAVVKGTNERTGVFIGQVGESSGTGQLPQIENCYATGTLEVSSRRCGGFVSYHFRGGIINCWSDVEMTTTSTDGNGTFVGRLGSDFQGTTPLIDKCFSKGTINQSVGAFCGDLDSGTISNSFWDSTIEAATSDGGTGKTTAQMQDIDTYTDTATAGLTNAWDMVAIGVYDDETWKIDDGNDYPILGWQIAGDPPDPDPTVTTQAVSAIDKTTATANGNVTDLGEEASVEAGHQFRIKNESEWTSTATQSLSATGAYTTSLTGLDPDTTYEVRSRITWDSGAEEDFGDTVEFTTDPLDAPTVTTQAATSVGSGGATLNGNVTSKGDFDPVNARFQYRVVGSATWLETSLATDVATGTYTFGLTGLTPETTYEFRAKVEYDTDQEVFGDTLEFTTLAGNTAPSVTTNAMTEIRATYATANGDVTSDGGEAVTERGFVWATTTAPDVSDNKVEVAGTTGEYSSRLSGLPPETLIYVRTYAINSEGTSYGNEVSFTTLSLEDVRNPVYIKDGDNLRRI